MVSSNLIKTYLLILIINLQYRQLVNAKRLPHKKLYKPRKKKVELNPLANKLFHSMRRNIQCPVCSESELAKCNWEQFEGGECQLPTLQNTCDCCPKCLSKEGESCGSLPDPQRPGYSHGFQDCERGLECTSIVGTGVCERLEGDMAIPGMDYYTDNYEDLYDYPVEEVEDENDDNSLPLEKGCQNHAGVVHFIGLYYPVPLGQPQWSPECQRKNSDLYKPVQCRRSEATRDYVCWCVDEVTGTPTLHMHWKPRDINAEMCQNLANDYGKKKVST